jgi:hypothetical protein
MGQQHHIEGRAVTVIRDGTATKRSLTAVEEQDHMEKC